MDVCSARYPESYAQKSDEDGMGKGGIREGRI